MLGILEDDKAWKEGRDTNTMKRLIGILMLPVVTVTLFLWAVFDFLQENLYAVMIGFCRWINAPEKGTPTEHTPNTEGTSTEQGPNTEVT